MSGIAIYVPNVNECYAPIKIFVTIDACHSSRFLNFEAGKLGIYNFLIGTNDECIENDFTVRNVNTNFGCGGRGFCGTRS
jgi:hypothetical protein